MLVLKNCNFLGELVEGYENTTGDILIDGDRIKSIAPCGTEWKDAEVVDMAGKYVLPGLFDLHIHLTLSGAPHGDVGYMLQKDTLFEWLTISANVELGLRVQKKLTEENRAYARALLEKYGLGEFAEHYPSQLSGGMRQRAALIRTLAFRPKLLLLDEPFSALDFQTRLDVADDVGKIIRQEGLTALLVTHDVPEAVGMGDRVIVLTPRPAVVKKIFTVPVSGTLSQKRTDPAVNELSEAVWQELRTG